MTPCIGVQHSLPQNICDRLSCCVLNVIHYYCTPSYTARAWKYDRTYKGKGKGHPRTGHEGPEGERMYSSTLPSSSALDVGGWSTPHPGRFTPRERPGTQCTGGWVGPRVGVDECGKYCPIGIRSPDRPARSAVATLTELSRTPWPKYIYIYESQMRMLQRRCIISSTSGLKHVTRRQG